MEIYLIILLLGYLLVTLFGYWLKSLNLRHLRKYGDVVPEEFKDYIDAGLLKKTRDYTLEHSRFGFIESIFGNILVLAFFFGGLLNMYNSWIVSFNMPFVLSGVVFFLVLSYANTIISIPFDLYSTFRIENKYGFNKMTWKLWISDFIKSTILSTILIGIMTAVALYLMKASPDFWWFFIWLFFLLFSIFMMYISPMLLNRCSISLRR